MRREKLISEIYKHAEYIGANKATLIFVLALTTDKALTKLHKDFLNNKKYVDE